jgi:DNA-binding transcriptional ArsR family regulator
MAKGTLALFGNPVRMRIVHALYDGRELTTAQLCERFPDISQATMYRHVSEMEQAGALEIVSVAKVRGAIERTYRLRLSEVQLAKSERAALTPDDLRRTMTTVATVMVSEFDQFLETARSPWKGGLSLVQLPLWLNDDELSELAATMQAFIARTQNNKAKGRKRYLLSPICFPLVPHDT